VTSREDRVKRHSVIAAVCLALAAAAALICPPALAISLVALIGLAFWWKIKNRALADARTTGIIVCCLIVVALMGLGNVLSRRALVRSDRLASVGRLVEALHQAEVAADRAWWDVAIQAEASERMLSIGARGEKVSASLQRPIERLKRLDPQSPLAWRLDGQLALSEERPADAWRALTRARIRAPHDQDLLAQIERLEQQLASRGLLHGGFDYTGARPTPTPDDLRWWDLCLLLLHLAGAAWVTVRWAHGDPLRAVELALVLLLLLVPWGQGGSLAGATVGRAILVSTAALTALWRRGLPPFGPDREEDGWLSWLPCLLVVLVAGTCTILAPDRAAARDGLMRLIWSLVLVVLSARLSTLRPAWPRTVVKLFAISAGLAGALCLLQRVLLGVGFDLRSLSSPLGIEGGGRPAADFFHPGHLGTFLVAAGLGVLGAALTATPIQRKLIVAGGVLTAVGLAQSARASLVAIAAGAALLAWLAGDRRRRRIILALLLGGLAIGTAGVAWRLSAGDPYAWTRIEIWGASIRAILSRPLFGFGPGGYPAFGPEFLFADTNEAALSRFGRLSYRPHSDLAAIFLDYGIGGGIIVFGSLLALGVRALASVRATCSRDPWMVGAAVALISLTAHGLVDDFIAARPAAALAAAILLGALLGRFTPTGVTAPTPLGPQTKPARYWIMTVLIATALLAGNVLPWLADFAMLRQHPSAATRLDPAGVGYWIAAARAAEGSPLERLAIANDNVMRATELLPEVGWPWVELAQVHEGALRGLLPTDDTLNAAIKAWTMALDRYAHDVQARRARGRLLAHKGDLAGAIHDFAQAVTDEPNFLGARLDLVRILQLTGDIEAARAALTELRSRVNVLEDAMPSSNYEAMLILISPEEKAEIAGYR